MSTARHASGEAAMFLFNLVYFPVGAFCLANWRSLGFFGVEWERASLYQVRIYEYYYRQQTADAQQTYRRQRECGSTDTYV